MDVYDEKIQTITIKLTREEARALYLLLPAKFEYEMWDKYRDILAEYRTFEEEGTTFEECKKILQELESELQDF